MGEDARDQGDQRGQRDAWKGLAGRFKTAADAVTAEMQAMPRDESQVCGRGQEVVGEPKLDRFEAVPRTAGRDPDGNDRVP
ncbi:uncharacterized protein TrAFT101_004897 [Trichoderma asperellum]|uniref:Uncharacterized protein n=1 Tax=Trichoderma asperellum (strain ATCC 204424 / CBS 433.97 / NBRC 101777) TaxID=1042311 RepID=A0A2T3Z5G9_TRIA4|nr:hypothetical protein M441DRAFT_27940 [Trichoderma asperellum CBS 433.97]PTB40059.1 hypothetical protein M441DRAFT_27940 [Trichoderma asperellum CBS 433.97]UKZ89857.1 hypothetical protein TrAFT101_004897 [Trichoderma asperellum]